MTAAKKLSAEARTVSLFTGQTDAEAPSRARDGTVGDDRPKPKRERKPQWSEDQGLIDKSPDFKSGRLRGYWWYGYETSRTVTVKDGLFGRKKTKTTRTTLAHIQKWHGRAVEPDGTPVHDFADPSEYVAFVDGAQIAITGSLTSARIAVERHMEKSR